MTAKEAIDAKCQEIRDELNRLQAVLRVSEAKHVGFKDALLIVDIYKVADFYLRKIDDKVSKEEEDTQETRHKIEEIKARLEAFEETKKLLNKDIDDDASNDLRAGSDLFKMREAIRKTSAPMTASALLLALGKEDTTEKRNSLRGSIGRYAKVNRIFVKTAPNTFGLVELGHKPENSTTEECSELPT
jgi:hypothetical protein